MLNIVLLKGVINMMTRLKLMRVIITVRLATGVQITVPKVPLNLGVKLLKFNCVERCLVLDLDSRYDLILGMDWIERHEPWIDWRSKILGATRIVSDETLESHEITFN